VAHLNHVLGPCQIVRFERARVTDAVVQAQGTEMVRGQRRYCSPFVVAVL
jgi:hypothetical protein